MNAFERCFGQRHRKYRRHIGIAIWITLTWWVTGAAGICAQETRGLRVRITWGGGARAVWRGAIGVSDGTVHHDRTLGLDEDAPGSFLEVDGTIPIRGRSAHAYDSLDIWVDAPLSAQLLVDLSAQGASSPASTIRVSLAELIKQPVSHALDDTGNLLYVQRTPGDALRVDWGQDHLVFAPGEGWRIRVTPTMLGVPDGTSLDLNASLRDTKTRDVMWRQSEPLTALIETTSPETVTWDIPMPLDEGVYDLELMVTAHDKRLFRSEPILVRRAVQSVVIARSNDSRSQPVAQWKNVASFDPTESHWWDRFVWQPVNLPHLKGIPPHTLGDRPLSSMEWEDRSYCRIPPGGWQAFQLPIKDISRPHMIEITYPRTYRQTLGVAIVEAERAATLGQLRPETCLDVDPNLLDVRGDEKLKFVFWPRSHEPYVLFTNRHDRQDALIGKIHVQVALGTLVPTRDDVSLVSSGHSPERRHALAFFGRPLFPETFGAEQGRDPTNGRSGDDWSTFLEGAQRLVDYLRFVGYDGATIAALSEGSTIYPADRLDPTPKYDTGAYFMSGQDPVRKDVLEMLLRVFDREGLMLVPTLQFSGPMPALERELNRNEQREGLVLTDASGKSYEAYHPVAGAFFASYNPLDQRVQDEILETVTHLVKRYGKHPSFGGVNIELSDGYCTHLPDATWGVDRVTVQHFLLDQKGEAEFAANAEAIDVAGVLIEPMRQKWLAWRAARLTQLYTKMAEVVREQNAHATLYLSPMQLTESPAIRAAIGPALPPSASADAAFLEMGIDVAALSKVTGLTFVRTAIHPGLGTLQSSAQNHEWNDHRGLDLLGSDHTESRANLAYHQPAPLRLDGFDQQHPFGNQNSTTWLAPQVVKADNQHRMRFIHALASRDVNQFMEGGWTILRGQPDSMQTILNTYRQLPAKPFTTLQLAEGSTSPIIVRTCAVDETSYLYLVNDSPWAARIAMNLQGTKIDAIQQLGSDKSRDEWQEQSGYVRWQRQLEPYGLVAIAVQSKELQIDGVEVKYSEQIIPYLRKRLTSLSERMANLATPQPWDVLNNAGFERVGVDGEVPDGWNAALGPGIRCELDGQSAHQGQYSCRVQSDGPVAWVRSMPFDPPATGRLAFRVWIRGAADGKSPPLRLAVEGKLAGKTYYRHAPIESETGGTVLGSEWAQYVLRVDDLPQEELEELRIGFDLMGPGTVWFDDVEIHNLSFTRNERNELSKSIAVAELQLRQGQVAECWQTMERYWPKFLEEFVTATPSITAATTPTPNNAPKSAAANAVAPTTGDEKDKEANKNRPNRMLDRVRRAMPFRRQ